MVKIANGSAVKVQRGHNDVRRCIACSLDDVLGAVGLDRFDPVRFQERVEPDFFGHHTLGLYAAFSTFCFKDIQNAIERVIVGRGKMHLCTVFLSIRRKLANVVVKVLEHMVANGCGMRAEIFPVVHFGNKSVALAGNNVLSGFDGSMLERI